MYILCIVYNMMLFCFFFFKQKTAYEMRISDWSSDVCSSDLPSIVYDIDAYRQFLENRLNIRDIYAYSYPPSTLPIAMLFAPMPYWLALMAWTFAGIIAFYCAARPYFNALGLPTLLALCNPAAFVCIWAGHYGLLVRSEEHTSELQSLMR